MQKVCLKIPGVAKPYSIMGTKLFEDERYFVIIDSNIRKKIPWENILYIEEIVGLVDDTERDQQQGSKPPQGPVKEMAKIDQLSEPSAPRVGYDELRKLAEQSRVGKKQTSEQIEIAQSNRLNGAPVDLVPTIGNPKMIDAQIFFEGHKEGVFKIPIPENLLDGQWTPELSRHIFSNNQISSFMGGFNVEKMNLIDGNVYIQTRSVRDEAMKDIENKMQMVGKIQESVSRLNEPKFKPPNMQLDNTFGITASPFDEPVTLITSKEPIDVYSGKEEVINKKEDS